jgi:hypothetical protein
VSLPYISKTYGVEAHLAVGSDANVDNELRVALLQAAETLTPGRREGAAAKLILKLGSRPKSKPKTSGERRAFTLEWVNDPESKTIVDAIQQNQPSSLQQSRQPLRYRSENPKESSIAAVCRKRISRPSISPWRNW